MVYRYVFRLISLAVFVSGFARAEEGFWPFDMVPKEAIAKRYEFNPSDEWLERARRGALRVSGGGSASFVSPHGLVLTNRHVAGAALQRLSVPGKTDLIRDGFLAKSAAEELRETGVRLEQLLEIINVNDKVRAVAERFGGNDVYALQAVAMEAERAEHIRIQPMKMYPDGEYRLYKFKVYDDVRLVFAADLSSGYFGGDADNFNYPRYNFDIAFFRAYENGKPVETTDYYPWSMSGAQENELIFAGSPGTTERSISLAHLELTRDKILPAEIAIFAKHAERLRRFAEVNSEQAQAIQNRRHQLENELKRLRGQLDGLLDADVFARKRAEEEAAVRSIADPAKLKMYTSALAEIRTAVERMKADQIEFQVLNNPQGLYSAQLAAAVSIAGMEAMGHYDFRGAELRAQRFETFYYYDSQHRQESERRQLQDAFELTVGLLGPDHALSKLILDGKTPAVRASELAAGTHLGQSDFYRNAMVNGFDGIGKSGDPMLLLAQKLVRRMRALNERQRREFDDVTKRCYPLMACAGANGIGAPRSGWQFFAATVVRTVRGYEDHGRIAPAFTTIGDMYTLCETAGNIEPMHLDSTWLSGRAKVDPCLPFNFVTDADGYGGNSGSPVFNRNREIVGILFDGNYPGLVGKFVYDGRTKRSVCVDSRAIVKVLERIYDAAELVKEFAP